ncbi:MAG: sulfotransferase family protein [Planctomycetota bacterium]
MGSLAEKLRKHVRYRLLRRIDADKPMIFGVGVSRTGTTSLTVALEELGYRAIHFPHCFDVVDGEVRFDWKWYLPTFDAFTDLPVARYYRELDGMYPNARFILTVRDEEKWLGSVTKFFSQERYDEVKDKPEFAQGVRLRGTFYGSPVYERDRYLSAMRDHNQAVRAYFADRPDKLIELDVTRPDAWRTLCGFLGKPVPNEDRPFPWANQGTAGRRKH